MDYLKRPFPFWPATWLAVAFVLLATRDKSSVGDASEYASAILAVSGLMYGGGYLVVGLATEVRYYYWSIMAILLATIIALPRLVTLLRTPSMNSWIWFGGLLGVLVAGYACRIFDVTLLVL